MKLKKKKTIRKEDGINQYKFILIFLFFSLGCSNEAPEVKWFNDINIATSYIYPKNRNLLILYTGHTWNDRIFEELLFTDSLVLSKLKEQEIDVLVLNYDDGNYDNRSLCYSMFGTKKWPVCGIVNKELKLISNLIFYESSKDSLRNKIIKLLN